MSSKSTWRERGNIIVPGRFIEVDISNGPVQRMRGIVTMEAVAPGTDIVLRTLTFNNLITDLGLNRIGSGSRNSMYRACCVGTGTTAPSVADTALQSPSSDWASTANSGRYFTIAGSSSGIVGPEYWAQANVMFVWPVGKFPGGANLTEVGFSGGSTGTDSDLSARALIIDSGGEPVAFPVGGEEELRVSYSFRHYLPGDVDWTGEVTIVGSGTHEVLMRQVRQGSIAYPGIGGGGGSDSHIYDVGNNSSARAAYTGEPVAFTSANTPTGSLGQSSAVTNAGYTPGSFYRDTSTQFNAGRGTGGIRTISISGGTALNFQCRYDPVITKGSTQSLIVNHRVAWGRYSP